MMFVYILTLFVCARALNRFYIIHPTVPRAMNSSKPSRFDLVIFPVDSGLIYSPGQIEREWCVSLVKEGSFLYQINNLY